jgi:adenylate cyclase class 2
MEKLEIEVKFYLADVEAMHTHILELGAKSSGRVFETNLRYEDKDNRMMKKKSLLRLRQDKKVTLTFKSSAPERSKAFKIYKELEVEVNEFETMGHILEALGYHPAQKYEKWRETFVLDQTLFCMDSMPYGNFLEIEGAEKEIRHYAAQLGLSWHKRILFNYLEMFEIMRKDFGLDFNDLTFQNFETVRMDFAAFADELKAGEP